MALQLVRRPRPYHCRRAGHELVHHRARLGWQRYWRFGRGHARRNARPQFRHQHVQCVVQSHRRSRSIDVGLHAQVEHSADRCGREPQSVWISRRRRPARRHTGECPFVGVQSVGIARRRKSSAQSWAVFAWWYDKAILGLFFFDLLIYLLLFIWIVFR